MARSRNIKPGLFKNELLGDADPLYTILFAGLWCLADREGRLENRPKRIKLEIFPLRPEANVDAGLEWLSTNGFITFYEVAGEKYIQISAWAKHQTPHHKEVDSVIPPMTPVKRVKQKPSKPHAKPVDDSCMDHASLNKSAPTPLIPDSLNLIPDSLIPDSRIPDSLPKADALVEPPPKAKSADTWEAYSSAYLTRYGVSPVRNAKTNSMLAQLVNRLGADAPEVAAFYVQHNSSYYVQRGHIPDALVADAEKLRTEWATGRKVTAISARQGEKTQANLDSHNEAIEILRAKGHAI